MFFSWYCVILTEWKVTKVYAPKHLYLSEYYHGNHTELVQVQGQIASQLNLVQHGVWSVTMLSVTMHQLNMYERARCRDFQQI